MNSSFNTTEVSPIHAQAMAALMENQALLDKLSKDIKPRITLTDEQKTLAAFRQVHGIELPIHATSADFEDAKLRLEASRRRLISFPGSTRRPADTTAPADHSIAAVA